jgi:hypothetical protein
MAGDLDHHLADCFGGILEMMEGALLVGALIMVYEN